MSESTASLTENPVILGKSEQALGLWFWWAIFFASAWLITLVYFLVRKNRKPEIKGQAFTEQSAAAVKNLKQACVKNDPVMAKDALLQWGRDTFQLSSLAKISDACDETLQNEILALNIILYRDKSKPWQGRSLWAAFQENKSSRKGKASVKSEPLPPLFEI